MGKLGMHIEMDGLACTWRIVKVVAHAGGGDQSQGPVPGVRMQSSRKKEKEKKKEGKKDGDGRRLCHMPLYSVCDYY